MFWFLPVGAIFIIALFIIHVLLFEYLFKFDYYTLIKEEFLRQLISEIDDTSFNISINEIKGQFEDVGNILFFKLYFDELNSLGLLNGEKIFPNISNLTDVLFKDVDRVIKEEGGDTFFSIPSNLSKKFIDDREDGLSELGKIYFYYYPLISYEAYFLKTSINQSFLRCL